MTKLFAWLNGKLDILVNKKIPVPRDKQLHIAAGLIICLAAGWPLGAVWGLLFAGIAGVFKEIWDIWSGKGTPECEDMLATWAGGVAGYVILAAILIWRQ